MDIRIMPLCDGLEIFDKMKQRTTELSNQDLSFIGG